MTLYARIILIAGIIAALGAAAVSFALHFENVGAQRERAIWIAVRDRDRAAQVQKDADAVEHFKQTERETSEHHEQELAQLRRESVTDRAAVDRAGGLRIAASACPSAGPAATAEAAGAIRRDEAGAATVRIPQPVEDGLWRLADDADEVSAQLRACQGWIRANGFYGPPPPLLVRMIAAPNELPEEPR